MRKNLNSLIRIASAVIIYICFAVYLYQPYSGGFSSLWVRGFLILNACLAAMGCFVLSRRWVSAFAGSLFAGAIYGFGPFTLGLASYHPTVGLLVAAVPWLFCPAAFSPKAGWWWVGMMLSALPFLAILIFFRITTHWRLFPIPIQTRLQLADLTGLLAPLVVISRNATAVGFYQVPIAALIMGFLMLLKAKRWAVITIFCSGIILAVWQSFFNISPIIWLALPVLCCSVLIGAGMAGMVTVGWADRKWLLAEVFVMGIMAAATLLLATEYFQVFAGMGTATARLFTRTAIMYLLGTISVGIIFFMARANLRIRWARWVILSLSMAVDIFLGARFVVDSIL